MVTAEKVNSKIETAAPAAGQAVGWKKPANPLEKVREARRALEQARRDLEAAVGDLPLGSFVKTDDLKALYQVVQEARKKLKVAENY